MEGEQTKQQTTIKEKKKFSPENNQYYLRQSQEQKQALYIAKVYLKKFEEVEIHAVGEALNLSVKLVEILQRMNLVTILKVDTFQIELGEGQEKRKKIKMITKIKRTSHFLSTNNINN